MDADTFIEALYAAGWRAPNDAQHAHIRELHARLFPVRLPAAQTIDLPATTRGRIDGGVLWLDLPGEVSHG